MSERERALRSQRLRSVTIVQVVFLIFAGILFLLGVGTSESSKEQRKIIVLIGPDNTIVRTYRKAELYPLNTMLEDYEGKSTAELLLEFKELYPAYESRGAYVKNNIPLPVSDDCYTGIGLVEWQEDQYFGQRRNCRIVEAGRFFIRPADEDPLAWAENNRTQ